MNPKITAIIPNFNHASVIQNCLKALMKQTEKNFQVLILDDASTDNSVEVITNFIQNDSRFYLVEKKKNSGVVDTLNEGIRLTKSPFIYLGAADDVISPLLFEKLLKPLVQHEDLGFAVCEVALIDDNKASSIQIRPFVRPANHLKVFDSADVRVLLKGIDNWALTGAALIRTVFLSDEFGLKESLGSSADGFALRRIALKNGFIFVPYQGLIWNRDRDGFSASTLLDSIVFSKQLQESLKEIERDSIFPNWYLKKYRNRMLFSRNMYLMNQDSYFVKGLKGFIYFLIYRPFNLTSLIKTYFGRKVEELISARKLTIS